jgi:predicted metal-dependent hydrolase
MVADGETVLYLGNSYTIQRGEYEHVSIDSTFLQVPREYVIVDIIAWLKEEALRVVTERTVFYADLIGVKFSAIKLSEAKSRWGSCSAKNNLNFAWRLIMCPVAAIDYIVVHELSHIKYKNHGAEFWARVKTVLPNYKEQQDWLKSSRNLMEII